MRALLPSLWPMAVSLRMRRPLLRTASELGSRASRSAVRCPWMRKPLRQRARPDWAGGGAHRRRDARGEHVYQPTPLPPARASIPSPVAYATDWCR